jgi:hypothetical protein
VFEFVDERHVFADATIGPYFEDGELHGDDEGVRKRGHSRTRGPTSPRS